ALSDRPTLAAPHGQLTVVSVASPGEVSLTLAGQTSLMDVSAFRRLGTIQISDAALLSTSGDGGGTITLRGGSLLVDGAGLAADSTLGARNGTQMGIDIDIAGDVVIRHGGAITAHTGISELARTGVPGERTPGGTGDAGALHIVAGSVHLIEGSFIQSVTG